MISRGAASLFALVIAGAFFSILFGGANAPDKVDSKQMENFRMAQAAPLSGLIDTGFSYSPALAEKFGLPAEDAIAMQAPLLGAALELKDGLVGKDCVLHVLFDASIDIRLPDAQSMQALGSNMDVFPNGFMQRPSKDIRQFFAAQIGALANRAIFRFGNRPLEGGATSGDDAEGSYTSMPLQGYNREFVPGVGWLAMSINCELASQEQYQYSALYVESNSSPSDMVLNGHVDASKMIELQVPQVLMDGMRESLRAAADESLSSPRRSRFSVFK
jgi:hypothetical protein